MLYVTVTANAIGFVIVTTGSGESPWQTAVVPLIVAVGVGLTVMLYVTAEPTHPFARGVMETVAVPVVAVKDGMEVTPV